MANFFYDSTGSATAPYDTWAKAATSLVTVAAAMAAGDTLFVGDDSNESVAGAIAAVFPGTTVSPNFIYCADHTKALPASADLKTGAAGAGSVTTTGNNAITLSGSFYCYGVFFSSGNGANTVAITLANASGNSQSFDNCVIKIGGTSGGAITLSRGCYFNNCTLTISSAASTMNANGRTFVRGGSLTGTGPNSFLSAAGGMEVLFEGVDLSNIASTKTLVLSSTTSAQSVIFKDCKLASGVVVLGAQTGLLNGTSIKAIRCDSGATNYRTEVHGAQGPMTTETTIVRTGGATDGTTTISYKAASNADCRWTFPLEFIPITFWNTSTSAITTLTIYGTTTGGGVPNDDDIWVEVEYLGSSATPVGSKISSSKASNLAASAATNNSSDASTWGGSGAGNGFKIVCPSFTPGMVGPVTIYVKVGKASSTYYIDPLPSISGVTISKTFAVSPGINHSELSAGSGGISRARAAAGF